VKFIAPIPVPVACIPLIDMPLIPPIAFPGAIDISDMVIDGFIFSEPDALIEVSVETVKSETVPMSHSMVTAGRDAVGIGIMLGADVMLDAASAEEEKAKRPAVVMVEICIVPPSCLSEDGTSGLYNVSRVGCSSDWMRRLEVQLAGLSIQGSSKVLK
jgi:hypothetical protein